MTTENSAGSTLSPRASEAVKRSLTPRQEAASRDVDTLIRCGRELLTRGEPARVADIVAAAGLSNDAFYRYFKSKGDFVDAVVEEGGHRLVRYLRHKIDQAADPDAALRAGIAAVLNQAVDPEIAAATRNVVSSAGGRSHAPKVREDLEKAVAEVLAGPIADLGSADPQRDSLTTSILLLAVMEHLLWRDASTFDADAEVEQIVGYARRGLRTS
ncbi:transcriptional regulator, TetR family [Rhodococcus rhodochrous J3]|uniref:TetR/AcrR family transcriptional regulator n=2 Tax=Rhodococcus rhodochrous TaxID=1829 RepID=A0AA46WXG6_RHORH|nr:MULTISPECIES: TetR/AcrR family transcriptional regulator [Rhodococcus]MCB8911276.1 TetR/AcrR family transcriptional regulator [Rhodococcus rhodochrous]MCD2097870.1 TetR/AcrR family transcriptional regulator [Rhodococcus rhodochrous]MCD2121829.1 TetR/AcrR family transcriptional regulator [Rhodococcus rhodochrous]MCQ4136792.1 TetR/AcrR family transcriptional regulator [Rhodococcus rhodochrous]MDC3724819.1 TetR/AcrR family transcriptional regulator [Rhodococcus sp. Rp3]